MSVPACSLQSQLRDASSRVAASQLLRARPATAPRTLVNANEEDIAVASLDRSAGVSVSRYATYIKLLIAFEPPSFSFLLDRGR